jgi:protein O-mannosyl-transferase
MYGVSESQRPFASWVAILLIAASTLLCYANSFTAPFIFDDVPTIVDNPAIRHLGTALSANASAESGGLTLSGRPVVALSLALNYAISGNAVWSYHALNIGIHLAAALTLFGLVRITLTRSVLRKRFGPSATPLAFAIALLWAVHPLQTESVTYIVQRAESMMALFYLLALYAFARGAELVAAQGSAASVVAGQLSSRASRGWLAMSVFTTVLGMATKEVMVTAPVVVFLYDRTFFAGSFRTAWRERKLFYGALAATWLFLAYFIVSTGGNRGGTVGFNVGVTPWAYAATQFEALVRYVQLSLWPHALVFEYGTFWVSRVTEVLPYALILLPLLALTLLALRRCSPVGFAGALAFAVLAPTSLTPGTIQMIVEHRMYLSLAPVVAVLVMLVFRCLGPSARWLLPLVVAVGVVVTANRNRDYRSELTLWTKTVAERPHNAIALANLGMAYFHAGDIATALEIDQRALRENPTNVEAHYNSGIIYAKLGRMDEAIAEYQRAISLRPKLAAAHNNLGNALAACGRTSDALAEYAEASRLDPYFAEPQNNIGNVLLQSGRPVEATERFEAALRLRADYAEARYNLGNAYAQQDRMQDAIVQYEQAVTADPRYADAYVNLGNALLQLGRVADASSRYEAALRLNPRLAEAHNNLGMVFLQTGRTAEAVAHFEQALAARPDFAAARDNLAEARAQLRSATSQ